MQCDASGAEELRPLTAGDGADARGRTSLTAIQRDAHYARSHRGADMIAALFKRESAETVPA
jgi:hypothetical protein